MNDVPKDDFAQAFRDVGDWLGSLFSRYRIRHIEGVGYTAEHFDFPMGWWCIGSAGAVNAGPASDAHDDFLGAICKTEAEAGARINKHAASSGKVVWKG